MNFGKFQPLYGRICGAIHCFAEETHASTMFCIFHKQKDHFPCAEIFCCIIQGLRRSRSKENVANKCNLPLNIFSQKSNHEVCSNHLRFLGLREYNFRKAS